MRFDEMDIYDLHTALGVEVGRVLESTPENRTVRKLRAITLLREIERRVVNVGRDVEILD